MGRPDGPELPYIIGHENAGTVAAVGDAVGTVAVGDKVILHPLVTCGLCRACRAGDDVHCVASEFPGLSRDGGMAEFMRTGVRSVVKLEEGLAPADVAALADAGLTAYHAVRKAVPLLYAGTRVVMIGAGGLGHIGLQTLLAITPAEVIVVDQSEEALAKAADLGAHHTVLAGGDSLAEVMDLTGGLGGHVVFDFVGEHGTEAAGVAMTREAGSYYVIGYGGHVDVPTIDLISRGDQHRRQPRRLLQRPGRADGAHGPGQGAAVHQDLPAHRRPHGAGRPRPREGARRPRHPHLDLSRSGAGTPLAAKRGAPARRLVHAGTVTTVPGKLAPATLGMPAAVQPLREPTAAGTVQSVSRALQALELVAARRDGATAREVAAHLDLALPSAYHLLATLTASGYLVHLAQEHRYGLGYRVQLLEQGLTRQLEVPAPVATAIARLHHDADAAAYYAVYRDVGVVVAHVVDSGRRRGCRPSTSASTRPCTRPRSARSCWPPWTAPGASTTSPRPACAA